MAKVTRHGGATNKTVAPIVTFPKGKATKQVVTYSDAEPVVVDHDVDDVYDRLTVAELRRELAERDLPTSGAKAELVERLLDDDTAPE